MECKNKPFNFELQRLLRFCVLSFQKIFEVWCYFNKANNR